MRDGPCRQQRSLATPEQEKRVEAESRMLWKAPPDNPARRRVGRVEVDHVQATVLILDGSCADPRGIADDDRGTSGKASLPDAPGERVRRRSAFDPSGVLRWRHLFPGAEVQLRELRRWLIALLPDCPPRDDALTVAVELAANAIKHSASGQAGGYFATEVTWYGPVVRIAVADGGGPNEPRLLDQPYRDESDEFDEHGHGLKMVEKLSARTGVIGDAGGRVVWAEVPWPDESASLSAALDYAHQETIATAERTLRGRFGEFLCWFGRETLEWWACPRYRGDASTGLVSARSAADLAELLIRARWGRLGPGRTPCQSVPPPPL
jgi:anti-sigma regulatory factor (Ser/Thr protein kinase)